MKKIKIVGGTILVACIVLFCLLWSGRKDETDSSLKIGVLAPLTGGAAFLGDACKDAISLAVESINNEGGIRGRKVELVWGNHENNPKENLSLFSRMKLQDVHLFFSVLSGPTVPLRPLLNTEDALLIGLIVSTHNVTEGFPWMFRFFVNADSDAGTMADFVANKCGIKEVGIIAVDDDMGHSFSEVFDKKCSQYGVTTVFKEYFRIDQRDFRDLVEKIKSKGMNGLYLVGYDSNLGVLASQIKAGGINVPIFSIGTLSQDNVRASAGDSIVGAYYTAVAYDPKASDPKTQEFVSLFKNKYGRVPNWYSAFAYDATCILCDALRKSNGKMVDIRQNLLSTKDYNGLLGVISFDGSQDPMIPMVVRKIEK